MARRAKIGATPRLVDVAWQRYKSAVPKSKLDLRVGILDEGELAFIGTVNEFGSSDGHVPARSFLRSSFDTNKKKYERMLIKGLKAMEQGTPLEGTVEAIGITHVADTKKKITKLRIPINAPQTVRRKLSSNPLIDTGLMRQVIEYEVIEE